MRCEFTVDIYSAEGHVAKLLEYVKSISETQPSMYKKSKDRLKKISDTCTEVVKCISEILQDEVLSDETEEFSATDTEVLKSHILSMESTISKLKSFLQVSDRATDSLQTKQSMKSVDEVSLYQKYKSSIEKLYLNQTPFKSVNQFSNILKVWFNSRFSSALDPLFRYNFSNVNYWIQLYVLVYSKHILTGTVDAFESHVLRWAVDEKFQKYAVPFEVNKLNQSIDSSDLTLTAVVLFDVLVDFGLSSLYKSESTDAACTSSCIYNLCESLNPSQLDEYVNYVYDVNILVKSGVATQAEVDKWCQ